MIFKLIFTVALAAVAHGVWGPINDLPPGPYCGNLTQCCIGREDHCAQPILGNTAGTLCYCDEFCNRTRSGDCCPDYFPVCLGEVAGNIISCEHNGQYYGESAKRVENCNECKCTSPDGQSSVWQCTRDPCMLESEVLELLNGDHRLNWHAANYSSFWGHKLEEGLRLKLGTIKPALTTMRMNPIRRTQNSRLPRSFDAREKWAGLITPIIEQGWCGASWAISTVAVASDRFAVMSRGAEHVTLSAQQLLSCNNRGQQSCSGGHLDRAWRFVRKFGLVDEPCFPYTGADDTKCSIPRRGNLRSAGCHVPPFRDQRYRTSPAHRLASEDDIMNDIQTSGPVQATMKVYQDFFHYAGGIYHQSKYGNVDLAGFHSVRIVGWGEEYGEKYWLVANSWGESWGEKGFFRIQRGKNECDIERFVIGVWAHTVEVFNI